VILHDPTGDNGEDEEFAVLFNLEDVDEDDLVIVADLRIS
jgi:hypothetical protein